MSFEAPLPSASEMNVRRASWKRRSRMPSVDRSSWNSSSVTCAVRTAAARRRNDQIIRLGPSAVRWLPSAQLPPRQHCGEHRVHRYEPRSVRLDALLDAGAAVECHLDREPAEGLRRRDAAKSLIAKLGPQASAQPDAGAAEEQITGEQAVRELLAALPALPVLLRDETMPPQFGDELRAALDAARRELDTSPAPSTSDPALPPPSITPTLLN